MNLSAEINDNLHDNPMTPEELEMKFILPSNVSGSESDKEDASDENKPKWCNKETYVPLDSESDDSDDEHDEDQKKKSSHDIFPNKIKSKIKSSKIPDETLDCDSDDSNDECDED